MLVAGIDEVGRGSWAGPLVASAVVLPKQTTITDVIDSKQLNLNQRLKTLNAIYTEAISIGLGWASPKYIDSNGITDATTAAMHQAVSSLDTSPLKLYMDGNYNYLPEYKDVELFVKGDEKKLNIGAASIVAKVARDRFMKKMDMLYPGYGFKTNVGYGSPEHRDALKRIGVTPLHRMTWKPMVSMKK